MRLGVIADTHGVLDPRALTALRGVEHILHAGDVGSPQILHDLEVIAPVSAVAGNIDAGTALGRRLPGVLARQFAGVQIFMTHIGGKPAELAGRLPAPRPQVYIFGHSHTALLEQVGDVLFLNPGAAGRPRFGGGLSVALLTLADGQPQAQIVPLR
ncbi:MAG TPA: metallophosphoesterase family protein [Roseiflexaceae bacterium]|nr:metallophosphoesterase family protein [Roseiflexaceae bacterium]